MPLTAGAPDPVIEQLLSYAESSEIVLGALQDDLERVGLHKADKNYSFVAKRFSRKAKVTTLLHQSALRDHCDRLHLHTSSLNLLLSTARLWVFQVFTKKPRSLISQQTVKQSKRCRAGFTRACLPKR
jgi:hypothetical protein